MNTHLAHVRRFTADPFSRQAAGPATNVPNRLQAPNDEVEPPRAAKEQR